MKYDSSLKHNFLTTNFILLIYSGILQRIEQLHQLKDKQVHEKHFREDAIKQHMEAIDRHKKAIDEIKK